MGLQKVGRHLQQALLERIGVGNHPAEKHIRSTWHGRQRRTEPPTGAALRHRQGLTAGPQLLQHHRRQAVVVGAEAEAATAGTDLRLHRHQQRIGLRRTGRPGRDPQLHLASAGVGRHRGVGLLQQIRHLLGQGRFRHAPEPQHPAGIHPVCEARVPQPGRRCGVPHRLHLTRHPRKCEHREPLLHREIQPGRIGSPDDAGRGAGGIGQQCGSHRQQRLTAIAGRHRASAGTEPGLDGGPHLRVLHQRRAEGRGDRFGGEVVGRGAEATGGDQHPAAASRLAQHGDQALAVVSHHGLALVADAQGSQLLRQPAGIAIGDVAEQQLRADAEDLSATAHRWESPPAEPAAGAARSCSL